MVFGEQYLIEHELPGLVNLYRYCVLFDRPCKDRLYCRRLGGLARNTNSYRSTWKTL